VDLAAIPETFLPDTSILFGGENFASKPPCRSALTT
jgi:hypothetical protein